MESTKKQVEDALIELEKLADEIRVRLHLAGMEAKDSWNKLEPRLADARTHAREAKEASKSAIQETIAAFRAFLGSIEKPSPA